MAMVAAVAGAALGSASNIYGGYQQNKYYQDLATQNEKQANLTLQNAEFEKNLTYDKAAQDSSQVQSQVNQTIGTQKSTMGASGISGKLTEDLERSSINQEYQDQLAIKYNSDLSAWQTTTNAKNEASTLRSQASAYRKAGKNAITQGWLGGGSSLLSSASSYAGGKGSK
jgi:hypothetical protein